MGAPPLPRIIIVQDQLMYQPDCVMDIVAAASVNRFSSIHRDQFVLYVLSRQVTSSNTKPEVALHRRGRHVENRYDTITRPRVVLVG